MKSPAQGRPGRGQVDWGRLATGFNGGGRKGEERRELERERKKQRQGLGGRGREMHPCFSSCTPVEEGVPERVELAEGLVRVNHKGVPRHGALGVPVHDCHEAVGGGLGPHAGAWHLLLQQVLDEAGLARAVLAGHQDHGLAVEIGIFQGWRVEGAESVVLLQGQQLGAVELLEGRGHCADGLGLLAPSTAPLHPAEHGGSTLPTGLADGDGHRLGEICLQEGHRVCWGPASQRRRRRRKGAGRWDGWRRMGELAGGGVGAAESTGGQEVRVPGGRW